MTRGGVDDVVSQTGGITVRKGWHGAKHFAAKQFLCCVWERDVLQLQPPPPAGVCCGQVKELSSHRKSWG